MRALIYMHVCKESRSLWWVSVSVSPLKQAGRCGFNLRSWPSARLPEEQSACFKLAANGLAASSSSGGTPRAPDRLRESRSQAGGSSSSLRRPEETALHTKGGRHDEWDPARPVKSASWCELRAARADFIRLETRRR